jgi:hypothetical protein
VVESPQETVTNSVEEASTNDLREALGLTEAPSQEVAPETAETLPEHEPEGQQPEVEGETEEDRLAKRRIRPRNEMDQQVIDLYRSEGFSGSFADASRIIYQTEAQSTPLQPQVAEAPQPDPYDGEVSALQAEISELEGKVTQAAEDLETTEALNLQREIMRKELVLQTVRGRREREVEASQRYAQESHQNKAIQSRDRVYERFPELQDKNNVSRKQFDDYVSRAQNDPDYASVFESPKWPELLANEFASIGGVQQQAQQALPPQSPQQQAPQMGTQARVLTTGTAAQPANSPLTANGVAAELPNLSSQDLYKLLGSAGGAQPLR